MKVEKCLVKVISENRSPGIQPEGGGQRDQKSNIYTLSLGTIVGFMRIPKSVLCYKYGNFLLMKICFGF